MLNKRVLATICALASQIIFGFSFMFTKIALRYASPFVVIADRYIVAFLGLSIVMIITRTKFHIGKNLWKLALMSIFQPVLYFIFESYGIQMTTSAFSSVMISLIPVVAMLIGTCILKEIPTILQYVFAAVSVLGVVIITLDGGSDGTVTFLGALYLFIAVISSVLYNVMSRKISGEFTALERTYAMTIIGLISFCLIAFIENIQTPLIMVRCFASFSYTTSLVYLGVCSSVFAFIMLNFANTYLPVAKTTVFANITTVVSVIAGAVFLDEKFSIISIIATVMIIFGVCGVQLSGKKEDV